MGVDKVKNSPVRFRSSDRLAQLVRVLSTECESPAVVMLVAGSNPALVDFFLCQSNIYAFFSLPQLPLFFAYSKKFNPFYHKSVCS